MDKSARGAAALTTLETVPPNQRQRQGAMSPIPAERHDQNPSPPRHAASLLPLGYLFFVLFFLFPLVTSRCHRGIPDKPSWIGGCCCQSRGVPPSDGCLFPSYFFFRRFVASFFPKLQLGLLIVVAVLTVLSAVSTQSRPNASPSVPLQSHAELLLSARVRFLASVAATLLVRQRRYLFCALAGRPSPRPDLRPEQLSTASNFTSKFCASHPLFTSVSCCSHTAPATATQKERTGLAAARYLLPFFSTSLLWVKKRCGVVRNPPSLCDKHSGLRKAVSSVGFALPRNPLRHTQ